MLVGVLSRSYDGLWGLVGVWLGVGRDCGAGRCWDQELGGIFRLVGLG